MTKKKEAGRDVSVFADWRGLGGPRLMGQLHIRRTRGSEIFSFEYDPAWLQSPPAIPLDPDLQLFRGELFPSRGQHQFGVFLDSAPDRWGRLLMRRRESLMARQEGRAERALYESDFLLGLHDQTRIGGLRFQDTATNQFLDSSSATGVPPWTSLRELEEACRKIEADELDSLEYRDALNVLLAPGSSLGGARPKASVRDQKNQLWMAKFPSKDDRLDTGAWEMVVHDLAKASGVEVPEAKLLLLGRPEHTYMARRFDRDAATGERIHFVSAMTLLQRKDGDGAHVGASYLELADLIQSQGARPKADLEQLWRRIVFSMLISNCDDHLRNHGFLLDTNGWVLSPAYDVNPDPQGNGLKLNVSENDNSQDLALARQVAPFFRLSKEKAEAVIAEMRKAVKRWEDVAKKYGIGASERSRAARAFRLALET